MTKEEILDREMPDIDYPHYQLNSFQVRTVLSSMDEYSKQEALGFFSWYGAKMMGFIFYLREVKPQITSEEIEAKPAEFEGQTFDNLYDLYLKSKEK